MVRVSRHRARKRQAAETVSERSIRYHRTLGLLDAAPGAYLRSFTGKHRLQLLAIRIYQAQGFPLRRIHEHLYGKTEEELREFVCKAGRQGALVVGPLRLVGEAEQWNVISLAPDLLILSREGRPIPPHVLHRLQAALAEFRLARPNQTAEQLRETHENRIFCI